MACGQANQRSLTTVQNITREVWLFQDYIDCFYSLFSTWNITFCSLFEISFYISLAKSFVETDLSCDRSYRFSNERYQNHDECSSNGGFNRWWRCSFSFSFNRKLIECIDIVNWMYYKAKEVFLLTHRFHWSRGNETGHWFCLIDALYCIRAQPHKRGQSMCMEKFCCIKRP